MKTHVETHGSYQERILSIAVSIDGKHDPMIEHNP